MTQSSPLYFLAVAVFTPGTKEQSDRRARKRIDFADLVLDIAPVAEMNPLWFVNEEHECWGIEAGLGREEEFYANATFLRRGMLTNDISH